MDVGIVGVGNMGTPIARNLLQAGHAVTVYDLDPQRVERLVKEGASGAAGLEEVARGRDVALTVLTWPDVVEDVVLGPAGLLTMLPPGATLIEASSIDHETSMRIGERARASGHRYIECALLGRPDEIEDGQLLFLTAGDTEAVAACHQLFTDAGQGNLHAGDLGRAKLLKMVNAVFNAAETLVAYEALHWCDENHVDRETFMELMRIHRPRRAANIDRMLSAGLRKHPSWTARDVASCVEMGEKLGVPIPVMSTVRDIIERAQEANAEGYAFAGMLWLYYEALAAER